MGYGEWWYEKYGFWHTLRLIREASEENEQRIKHELVRWFHVA